MAAPAALSIGPALPFKYVGGDPSVDLVNTVDWTARGLVEDRLTDYERLTRWAEGAGVIASRQAARLRSLAAAQPRMAERAYRDAIEVRRLLRGLFTSVAQGQRAEPNALEAFNERLGVALARLELVPATRGSGAAPLQWGWRVEAQELASILWPVLRSAAELLVSDEAGSIRECAGADCGWMYVDRSRNGLRRWCQMETCGNREKSRRRRAG